MTLFCSTQGNALKKTALYAMILGAALAAPAPAQSAPRPSQFDAASQLRTTQQGLLQQEVVRETEKRLLHKEEAPELTRPKDEAAPDIELRFHLTKVQHNPSKVLTEKDLAPIFAKYEGREVSIQELYAMLAEINDLYFKKGYLVARAFLLPQKIAGGVLNIRLVEGTTDAVSLHGNASTRPAYVLNSLNLKRGDVANFRDMNQRLLRFNMLNDVFLRIEVEPGEKPETTQYVLRLQESKRQSVSLFADNSGSSYSGRERAGFSYLNRSLTGWRDSMSLSGIFSENSSAGYLNYSRQIGRTGAKLTLGGSANMMRVDDMTTSGTVVKSEAQGVNLMYEYPWRADGVRRQRLLAEASMRWNKTSADGIMIIRQKINGFSLGADFLTYGKASALYHSHTFSYNTVEEDYWQTDDSYWLYRLFALWQRAGARGNLLTAKLNMTLDLGGDDAATADNFFLGGPYSVRGYEKDIISGSNGVSLNLEYALPSVMKKFDLRPFVFFDTGYVWENVYGTDSISSVGVGIRSDISGKGAFSLSLGFPLDKNVAYEKVDSARIDCSVSWTF